MNLYRNCFKHLGRTETEKKQDQTALDQFDDSKNEYLLYVCVEDALHVDLISDNSFPKQELLDRFPGIQNMDRQQQKCVAVGIISRYSYDLSFLANPGTEPLILRLNLYLSS